MLVRFTVENWKSFKEPTSISFVAQKEKQHSNHIQYVPEYDLNVLPISLIYGGNASGKSNLVKAIAFASQMITSTDFNPFGKFLLDYFRLSKECADKPSFFAFDLIIDEKLFHYDFSLFNSEVTKETLICFNEKRKSLLFSRENGVYKFSPNIPKTSKEHFQSTLPNKLALSSVLTKKLEGMDSIQKVFNWFRTSLMILSPESKLIQFNDRTLPVRNLSHTLSLIDTGISRIDFEEITPQASGFSSSDLEDIQQILSAGNKMVWAVNLADDFCKFEFRNSQLTVFKMVSYHKNENDEEVRFEIKENSDGFRRCLHLFPAFHSLTAQGSDVCIVVDELDRSLHSNLVKQLLVSFLETRNQDTRSQLILTNHDILQMDQEVLRRDEIWISERNERNGATSLTALYEYKMPKGYIRKDHCLTKLYLSGQLGGTPKLNSFGGLFSEKENANNA